MTLTALLLVLVAIFVGAVVVATMTFIRGIRQNREPMADRYDYDDYYEGYDEDEHFSDVQQAVKEDVVDGGTQLRLWETGAMPAVEVEVRNGPVYIVDGEVVAAGHYAPLPEVADHVAAIHAIAAKYGAKPSEVEQAPASVFEDSEFSEWFKQWDIQRQRDLAADLAEIGVSVNG